MEYKLIEVKSTKEAESFHDAMRAIYKGDPNFICPLDETIEGIFTPSKNIFFSHGEAIRWVLYDSGNKFAGRIAAFINKNKAFTFQQPTGGIGFFECVNDQKAADILFDAGKKWLQERGMEAMDGPINFGENDNFWGLLVEGFMPQSFGMNYHKPYYKELFENYGFTFYFEQVTNHLDITKPFPERFWKIADWISKKPEYKFEHLHLDNIEKYIGDLAEIYNDAWQFHENFTPLTREALLRTLNEIKSVLIPEFIWFAYHEAEPIAFLIMLPDLNQLFRHFNGKMNIFDKLWVLFKGKKSFYTRSRITIMGVKPQFQKSGIESGIFKHMEGMMAAYPKFTEIELSWVGDFNPKMRQLHESVGAHFAKRHITYRCYFGSTGEKHRSTIIPVDTREKLLNKSDEFQK